MPPGARILGRSKLPQQTAREAVSGSRRPDTPYGFSAVRFAQLHLTKLEPGLRRHELGDYVACYSAKRELDFRPGLEATYLPTDYERVTLADYLKRYEDQTALPRLTKTNRHSERRRF